MVKNLVIVCIVIHVSTLSEVYMYSEAYKTGIDQIILCKYIYVTTK